MKFIPAPDMWDPQVQQAVISGALKLLPGQRIRCGSGRTSIFAGVTAGGTIWAVHWNGKGYNWDQFRAMRRSLSASGRA
ncbi:TPA: hypothetical protein ACSCXL_004324 [Aeromonas veronii]